MIGTARFISEFEIALYLAPFRFRAYASVAVLCRVLPIMYVSAFEQAVHLAVSCDDLATVIVPLGQRDEETDKRLTIASVNGGKDYLEDQDAVEKYGRLCCCKASFTSISLSLPHCLQADL